MEFIIRFKTVIDLYAAILCLWWLKRRIYSKWEKEKEYFSSDFL